MIGLTLSLTMMVLKGVVIAPLILLEESTELRISVSFLIQKHSNEGIINERTSAASDASS